MQRETEFFRYRAGVGLLSSAEESRREKSHSFLNMKGAEERGVKSER